MAAPPHMMLTTIAAVSWDPYALTLSTTTPWSAAKIATAARFGGAIGNRPTAPAYQAALRSYLEKAGAQFIDETHDADVTLDYFGSGDHVKTSMMKPYTELFWRKVGPLLDPPAPR